jgi:hypothetical protein
MSVSRPPTWVRKQKMFVSRRPTLVRNGPTLVHARPTLVSEQSTLVTDRWMPSERSSRAIGGRSRHEEEGIAPSALEGSVLGRTRTAISFPLTSPVRTSSRLLTLSSAFFHTEAPVAGNAVVCTVYSRPRFDVAAFAGSSPTLFFFATRTFAVPGVLPSVISEISGASGAGENRYRVDQGVPIPRRVKALGGRCYQRGSGSPCWNDVTLRKVRRILSHHNQKVVSPCL